MELDASKAVQNHQQLLVLGFRSLESNIKASKSVVTFACCTFPLSVFCATTMEVCASCIFKYLHHSCFFYEVERTDWIIFGSHVVLELSLLNCILNSVTDWYYEVISEAPSPSGIFVATEYATLCDKCFKLNHFSKQNVETFKAFGWKNFKNLFLS